jgi:hypothetical protein
LAATDGLELMLWFLNPGFDDKPSGYTYRP